MAQRTFGRFVDPGLLPRSSGRGAALIAHPGDPLWTNLLARNGEDLRDARATLRGQSPDDLRRTAQRDRLREALTRARPDPRRRPGPQTIATPTLPYAPRVLFKIPEAHGDGLPPRLRDGWRRVQATFPEAQVSRALPVADARLREWGFDEGRRWFAVQLPHDQDPHALSALMRLALVDHLAHRRPPLGAPENSPWEPVLYVEPKPAPPPTPPTDPLVGLQRYLSAAPYGVGVAGTFDRPGADGAGVRLVDVEHGWSLCHDDLPKDPSGRPAVRLIHGVNYLWPEHGTAALGIIAATRGTEFGTGIAPAVRAYACSPWAVRAGHTFAPSWGWAQAARDDPAAIAVDAGEGRPLVYDLPLALLRSLEVLRRGDILLIQQQVEVPMIWPGLSAPTPALLPVEVAEATYDVVRHLTEVHGITVIEAAGNGNLDLDQYMHPTAGLIFHRGHPDARPDSGAILVGAADPDTGERAHFLGGQGSNYGSRVDCNAWGAAVATIGGDNSDPRGRRSFTPEFGGTSSAAAIIAGLAASIQGAARADVGAPLEPHALRLQLSSHGTARARGPMMTGIQRMPDLSATLDAVLGPPPPDVDVWLRDFDGDTGDGAPGGALPPGSGSPDIAADGTLTANQPGSLTVRLRNRGTQPALSVVVHALATRADLAFDLSGSQPLASVSVAVVPPDTDGGPPAQAQLSFTPTLGAGAYALFVVLDAPDDPATPMPSGTSDQAVIAWLMSHNNATVHLMDVRP